MEYRFLALIVFLCLASLTSGCDVKKRHIAGKQEATKSGEKIKFITPSRDDYYVSCSPPKYKCCDRASAVVTPSKSKCLTDKNTTGICCNPHEDDSQFTVLEADFNGTPILLETNRGKEELKKKFDDMAKVIEANRKLREKMEKSNATAKIQNEKTTEATS